MRAFNPGEGGQTEAEIDISLGLGGSITYGFRSVAFPVPVLFRVTDLGPVYEPFRVDIRGTDSEHVSTVGRAETYLLVEVSSGVTVKITDLKSHKEVGDPYKGTDVSPKATELKIKITELGFSGDYMISKWPDGTKIDDPDGSSPTWKREDNPNDPVCYTKGFKVTMFAKLSISPELPKQVTGVSIRAKSDSTIFAQKDNVTLAGESVDIINIPGTTPLETTVKTTTPAFTWEISLDGGTKWSSLGNSGPHTMHWVKATPLEDPLYDLALEKACGYVNGSSDIAGKINIGIDNDISYDPTYDVSDTLNLYSEGRGQCSNHADLMTLLVKSVGVSGSTVYIWGGCASDYICMYIYQTWWGPSFRVIKAAHDSAEANPHFLFHAETSVGGIYYDPSYGSTGLITLNETAPAGVPYFMNNQYYDNHSAATRQIGGSLPGTEHYVIWTCPH